LTWLGRNALTHLVELLEGLFGIDALILYQEPVLWIGQDVLDMLLVGCLSGVVLLLGPEAVAHD